MLALLSLSLLILSGCKNFLTPELGAIANADSRIALQSGKNVYKGKDLSFTYSLEAGTSDVGIKGRLAFDRGLTDSFPVAKNFFFKMSFLDSEGRVIETVDITPMIKYRNPVVNPLTLAEKKFNRPAGTTHIVFNYFGVFIGDGSDITEEWEVFQFPFI